MSLNTKKKRKKARDKIIEDRRMKWCGTVAASLGMGRSSHEHRRSSDGPRRGAAV